MKTLFIVNDPAYGPERVFKALRGASICVWGYSCHRQSSRHAASLKSIGQGS
jgi:hypothetical protein